MDRLRLVKIGGTLLEREDGLGAFLDAFAGLRGRRILVHGGGAQASRIGRKLGVEPVMKEGRRITDPATLDVVTMVYAGLNAKRIVAALQARGCNAVSLSGPDGNLLSARRRPVGEIDFGFVGDVERNGVNAELLAALLNEGLVPVLNAITHDRSGTLLNTNADTIAATVAGAMSDLFDVELTFVLDRPGVLADPGRDESVLPYLTPSQVDNLKQSGAIGGGMIPKIDNAVTALSNGVAAVRICGAEGLGDPNSGTKILNDR